MNPEELNELWERFDQKLDNSLQFNEQLLKKVNFNQMQKELAKPIRLELWTIFFTSVLVVYLLGLSVMLIEELKFSLTGIIAASCGLGLIGFALRRVRAFRKLNYSSQNILTLQQELHSIQLKRLQSGRLELLFGILAATLMWPIVLYTGFELDIYSQFSYWGLALFAVAFFSIPATIAFERHYRAKMEKASELLKEMEGLSNG